MSSYEMKARQKITGNVVTVLALDDYFGRRQYGYQPLGVGDVMREEEFYQWYEEVKPHELQKH